MERALSKKMSHGNRNKAICKTYVFNITSNILKVSVYKQNYNQYYKENNPRGSKFQNYKKYVSFCFVYKFNFINGTRNGSAATWPYSKAEHSKSLRKIFQIIFRNRRNFLVRIYSIYDNLNVKV